MIANILYYGSAIALGCATGWVLYRLFIGPMLFPSCTPRRPTMTTSDYSPAMLRLLREMRRMEGEGYYLSPGECYWGWWSPEREAWHFETPPAHGNTLKALRKRGALTTERVEAPSRTHTTVPIHRLTDTGREVADHE